MPKWHLFRTTPIPERCRCRMHFETAKPRNCNQMTGIIALSCILLPTATLAPNFIASVALYFDTGTTVNTVNVHDVDEQRTSGFSVDPFIK